MALVGSELWAARKAAMDAVSSPSSANPADTVAFRNALGLAAATACATYIEASGGGAGDVETYVHPETHPPSIIAQDASNRFMTDAERNKLAGIEEGAEPNVATNLAQGTRTATSVPVTSSTGTDADLSAATGSLAGVMTAADKVKLDGVAAGANNYEHPVNHAPSVITQDSDNRFVTDAEKTTWNGKADASHGTHVSYSSANPLINGTAAQGTSPNLSRQDHVHPTDTGRMANTKAAVEAVLTGTLTSHNHDGVYALPVIATTTTSGLMSDGDKAKLDGIAAGANNYTHPASHPATMIDEDTTHRFMTDAERTKLTGIETAANNYAHPSGSGSTHLPASGATSQLIIYGGSAGVGAWSAMTNTLHGTRGGGTQHSAVVAAGANGFMTGADKTKLDGVATGANNYVHPASHLPSIITQDASNRFFTDTERTKLAGVATNANLYVHPSTHAPSIITQDASNRFVTDAEKTTWNDKAGSTVATTSANGLMSSTDKTKLEEAYFADDIRLYGAEKDATNNIAAISAALLARDSAYIPPGVWMSGPITLGNDQRLHGAGRKSSTLRLIEGLPSGSHLVNASSVASPVISNITLDGNAAAYTLGNNVTCVQFLSVSKPRLEQVHVTGGIAEGVYFYSCSDTVVEAIDSSNNGPVGGGDAAGVHLDNCYGYHITGVSNDNGMYGVFVNNCGPGVLNISACRNGVDGVRVYQSNGCVISGQSSYNANRGVYFNASTRCFLDGATLTENLGHGFVSYDSTDCGLTSVSSFSNGGCGVSAEGVSTLTLVGVKHAMNVEGDRYVDATSIITDIESSVKTVANPNILINGRFLVNQRGVSGTVTLAAGAYGHDRWKAGAAGCTYTFAAINGETTLTISAGSLLQIVEGGNVPHGDVVLSWQGTAQGKIGAGVYGTSGVTASATGGSNLTVEFGTGTLARVKLEEGSVATPYPYEDLGETLRKCQWYWQYVVYEYRMDYPANNTIFARPTLPTVMRAAPVVTRNDTAVMNIHSIDILSSPRDLRVTYGVYGGATHLATNLSLDAEL